MSEAVTLKDLLAMKAEDHQRIIKKIRLAERGALLEICLAFIQGVQKNLKAERGRSFRLESALGAEQQHSAELQRQINAREAAAEAAATDWRECRIKLTEQRDTLQRRLDRSTEMIEHMEAEWQKAKAYVELMAQQALVRIAQAEAQADSFQTICEQSALMQVPVQMLEDGTGFFVPSPFDVEATEELESVNEPE